MKNIDINEWLLNNNIDPNTEIVADGKQFFLSDILEKHLKEQLVIYKKNSCNGLHSTDRMGKCFKCGKQIIII